MPYSLFAIKKRTFATIQLSQCAAANRINKLQLPKIPTSRNRVKQNHHNHHEPQPQRLRSCTAVNYFGLQIAAKLFQMIATCKPHHHKQQGK